MRIYEYGRYFRLEIFFYSEVGLDTLTFTSKDLGKLISIVEEEVSKRVNYISLVSLFDNHNGEIDARVELFPKYKCMDTTFTWSMFKLFSPNCGGRGDLKEYVDFIKKNFVT